jgi:hypothetical protein
MQSLRYFSCAEVQEAMELEYFQDRQSQKEGRCVRSHHAHMAQMTSKIGV